MDIRNLIETLFLALGVASLVIVFVWLAQWLMAFVSAWWEMLL